MMMSEACCWIECRFHVGATSGDLQRTPAEAGDTIVACRSRPTYPSSRSCEPQLRAAAAALERARMVGSVLDHEWRTIFLSTEQAAVFPDADLSTGLGVSKIVQTLERRLPFVVPVETRLRWWEALGAAIRHDVSPDDPDFEAVFGPMADIARDLEPRTPDWAVVVERELTDDEARSLVWHGRISH